MANLLPKSPPEVPQPSTVQEYRSRLAQDIADPNLYYPSELNISLKTSANGTIACNWYSLRKIFETSHIWMPNAEEKLLKKFPFAKTIVENVPGVVAAGGSCIRAIYNNTPSDLDLFIVDGGDIDKHWVAVRQVIEQYFADTSLVYEIIEYSSMYARTFSIRSGSAANKLYSSAIVQLVDRSYVGIKSVLDSFDMPISRIAYVGGTRGSDHAPFAFTAEAYRAACEYLMVLDERRLGKTAHLHRMIKYGKLIRILLPIDTAASTVDTEGNGTYYIGATTGLATDIVLRIHSLDPWSYQHCNDMGSVEFGRVYVKNEAANRYEMPPSGYEQIMVDYMDRDFDTIDYINVTHYICGNYSKILKYVTNDRQWWEFRGLRHQLKRSLMNQNIDFDVWFPRYRELPVDQSDYLINIWSELRSIANDDGHAIWPALLVDSLLNNIVCDISDDVVRAVGRDLTFANRGDSDPFAFEVPDMRIFFGRSYIEPSDSPYVVASTHLPPLTNPENHNENASNANDTNNTNNTNNTDDILGYF